MKIKDTSAHFIGIGGVGMSALAHLFHSMGAKVSGSDIKSNKLIVDLQKKGIKVFIGHGRENIDEDLNVVVYSSAIDRSNPEVQKASELKIPLIPRAEALGEIMRFKRGIAVGGTHGKTTTTSMISSIFMHAKMDPTIAVGGRLQLIESTARLGQGPWMVAEADESDGSFLRLFPEIAIITNINNDHIDHYKSFANLQKAFMNFALNVPYYGCAVVCGDDPAVRELFSHFTKKIYFYGEGAHNDYVLKIGRNSYEIFKGQKDMGSFQLKVPGKHNAMNALAACIASHSAGILWEDCMEGVRTYSGVDRRFQRIGESNGVTVFDDYAHHPTEIAATIAAGMTVKGNGKLHLIYQPHRYTRTRDCWQDYKKCFEGVDQLYLVDIYPAGESPIEGVTSADLANTLTVKSDYFSDRNSLIGAVTAKVQPGDIVMTMGAGNIWEVAHLLLESMVKKR